MSNPVSYRNAIQALTPSLVCTPDGTVNPVVVNTIPDAAAGVVTAPVEPVVNMVSVGNASVAINIFGFVAPTANHTITIDGTNPVISVTSAALDALVNRPVRNPGYANDLVALAIVELLYSPLLFD